MSGSFRSAARLARVGASVLTGICLASGFVFAQNRSAGAVVTPDRLLSDFSRPRSVPSPPQWIPGTKSLLFSAERWRLASCAQPKVPDAASSPGGAKAKAEDRSEEWIVRLDSGTGRCALIMAGTAPDVSPSGKEFAFRRGEVRKAEIWLAGADGSSSRRLVDFAIEPFHEYYIRTAWSPDGGRLAYSFAPAVAPKPPSAPAEPTAAKPTVRVYGGAGDTPPDTEIWTVDASSGKAQPLAHVPLNVTDLSWRRDGRGIVMAVVERFENRPEHIWGEVRSLSAPGGRFETLVKNAGVQQLRPIVSPDGKQIAFTTDPNNVFYPDFYSVAVVPVDGGPIRTLTRELFVDSVPVWSPDSRTLYFIVKKGGFDQIFSVDLAGHSRPLTDGPASCGAPAVSSDGRQLAWVARDLLGHTELRVAGSDGSGARTLVDLAPEVSGLRLSPGREVRWKSRDGLEIAGYLIPPLDPAPGGKPPLLVDLHGGPVGGLGLGGSILGVSPLEWQMWAARGYLVFVPDYRSSGVYGWKEITGARERQDANEKDFDDILSGVDHVIATENADPDRLALLGHSYGALMTNWIVTHSHRFRVAVSYEGAGVMQLDYGTGHSSGGNDAFEWFFKGKPWEAPENYRKQSSSEFVKGVTTPTMFISGAYGKDLFDNEYFYTAWKKQGIDTEFLVYGNEGHSIFQPANQRDLLERVLAWIGKYVAAP